jgi:membrane-anchored protein YejM (alkaline phosphatase superfamily)
LFYGGYYLNAHVLPAKLHPASLAADAALLAVCWLLVRFAPPIKIRRRSLAAAFAVLLAGAVVVSVVAVGSSRRLGAPETKPPEDAANLLLVTMDTTRADRLGAYGGPPGLTPNLDRLAASGVVFERGYCPMPLTGPSHAALLTGLTPRENGVVQNGVPLGTDPPTMAEVLRSRGFRTGAVVAAFPVSSKLGFARGFEFFDDDFAAADALSRLTTLRLTGSLGIIDAKARLQRPADEVTPPAIRWLKDDRNRPFFLWVHYFDPHTPYEPPYAYWNSTDAENPQVRLYDGEIAFMDAHVGQLLAALDDLGLRENTVVVAVADHGESLGEHDYYYDHGRYVYDWLRWRLCTISC